MRSVVTKAVAGLTVLSALASCAHVAPPVAVPAAMPATDGVSVLARLKPDQYANDSVVVGVRDAAMATQLGQRHGLKLGRFIPGIRAAVYDLPPATDARSLANLLQKLGSEAGVRYAEPNFRTPVADRETMRDPAGMRTQAYGLNDPLSEHLYQLERMRIPEAWQITRGSPQVVVAVVDSGVDVAHPDLKDQVVPGYNAGSRKAGNEHVKPMWPVFLPFAPKQISGGLAHGTHVAGIIAAKANDRYGIAGVAPGAKIMPISLMGQSADRSAAGNDQDAQLAAMTATVADGITWATDHGAHVINLSLGFEVPSKVLAEATAYAIGKGVTVVVAAGNSRQSGNAPNLLAALPGVIAVGATDRKDEIAPFSTSAAYVSVSAPGYDVLSTFPSRLGLTKTHVLMSGTSMAAPCVAGVAALLKSRFPGMSPQQIKQRLEQTADDLGTPGHDEFFGHGRVNALRALSQEG